MHRRIDHGIFNIDAPACTVRFESLFSNDETTMRWDERSKHETPPRQCPQKSRKNQEPKAQSFVARNHKANTNKKDLRAKDETQGLDRMRHESLDHRGKASTAKAALPLEPLDEA